MKRLFFLIAILGLPITALAQTGTVKGTVTSADNTPVEYVTITIGQNGTAKGALTDSRGTYEITGVQPGAYLLKASSVGLRTQEIRIVVRGNETTTVPNIVLTEQQEQLDEVIVEGQKTNKYAQKESAYVSKMPLKDIENPQVFNSIGSELLEDQVVTNFNDALKNAPGISLLWEPTGRGNDGAGYFSVRGFAVQPTMVNGLPALTNGSPDLANTDRIEIIKGPSGTLYGSSLISYGGLINIVTKKPFSTFRGNISYTAGSYGQNRVTVDVNTPLSREKDIFLRVNSAYHTQNSYQDAGFRRSFFVAPSLSYQVNDRLSFSINTEIYDGRTTNQTMLFLDRGNPLRVHNMDELNYDHKRSYTSNDLYIDNPTYSLQAQINYKLNDQWTSQTSLSTSSAKSKGYYSYLYEATTAVETATSVTLDDGIVFARYISKQNSETTGTDIQQNFIGDFKIGSLRNRLVVGFDYLSLNVVDNSTGYGNQGFVYIGSNIAQFQQIAPALHEAYGIPMRPNTIDDSGILTQAAADAGIALSNNPGGVQSRAKQEVLSAYASDVINLLPELSAMASLRVDRFWNDGYNQTAFSPKFGLVYQPVLNKVSLFANYMDGFSNTAPVTELTDGTASTKSLKPEHANQLEFGTKLNLFDDKLIASLSYYDIKVTDRALRIDTEGGNYYYTQDGEQNSKGFEASINASPVRGLNIIAGYSYNDSKLEKGAADFVGRRPGEAGPLNAANFWAGYQFSGGKLDGFGIGFGGNYGGEHKTMDRATTGVFTLPEYTVLNSSVFYGTESFRITLKLDNITNEEYYKGWSTINPQWTRTVSANFSYTF